MNTKTIVLLIIAGIVVTTISGCLQEKAPEQLSPPTPKYTVRMVVSDVTDKYPDLSAQASGWYNPFTRQKVSRYADPNLGTIGRRMTVLLSTSTIPETKIGMVLKPYPKQGIFFYDNIFEDGFPLSRYSKHQREARQVYEIDVEYDVPEKEELTIKDEQGMALQIYSTSLNENFKIVFAEPNTLPEGYS